MHTLIVERMSVCDRQAHDRQFKDSVKIVLWQYLQLVLVVSLFPLSYNLQNLLITSKQLDKNQLRGIYNSDISSFYWLIQRYFYYSSLNFVTNSHFFEHFLWKLPTCFPTFPLFYFSIVTFGHVQRSQNPHNFFLPIRFLMFLEKQLAIIDSEGSRYVVSLNLNLACFVRENE